MSNEIHSCGYFCNRPPCAIAQRDELVMNKSHMEERIKELEAERDALKAQAKRWELVITGHLYVEFEELDSQSIYIAMNDDGRYFTTREEAEAYIDAAREKP